MLQRLERPVAPEPVKRREPGDWTRRADGPRTAPPACNGKVHLCGVGLHPLTMDEVMQRVRHAVRTREPLAISVVNVAKLVNMQRNPQLRASVESGDLVLADGMPLVWLSRWRGGRLPERVAGIDLMFELMALADRERLRVFLLGAHPEVLLEVVRVAGARYPRMVICGARDGYFRDDQQKEVAQQVRSARPDILLVAISSPKKELFMERWSQVMRVPVCHGVGGSFDVMAGLTRRAPHWMQRCGLEWLYRVMQEPRRMWRRYLVTNAIFVGLAARELLTRRQMRGT